MKDLSSQFGVEEMARTLGVSRTGYYCYLSRSPSRRSADNDRLLLQIKQIHEDSGQTYGSPRIQAELKDRGETCSRPRVARLMHAHGIKSKVHKKFVKTTKRSQTNKVSRDLVQQNFSTPKPNTVWVTDITYIWAGNKWIYLAIVLDLFARKVVGMAIQDHMKVDLVLEALKQAVSMRRPDAGIIYHADQGSQFTSQEVYKYATQNGIILSHGHTGCAYDNAVMESFFHTLKTEHVYFENYKTLSQAKASIFAYIFAFYNTKRRHSTLNYQTPAQTEMNFYANNSIYV